MSKIIDYKTLSASYPDELDEKVNEAIKKGWQPHGYQFFQSAFHQPMVKEEERSNEYETTEELIYSLDLTEHQRKFLIRIAKNKGFLETHPAWLHELSAAEIFKQRYCGKLITTKIVEALKNEGFNLNTDGLEFLK